MTVMTNACPPTAASQPDLIGAGNGVFTSPLPTGDSQRLSKLVASAANGRRGRY